MDARPILAIVITTITAGCTDWDRLSRDYNSATAPDGGPAQGQAGCATYVVAGDVHSCVRRANGELLCWGDNKFGELGTGDTTRRQTPTTIDVFGLGTNKIYLPSGNGDITSDLAAFTCAIVGGADDLYCWGDNRFGQLGTGDTKSTSKPVKIDTLPGKPSRVANGAGHSCAQTIDNALYCWGKNASGQLGTGDTQQREKPTRINLGRPIERLTAAGDFTCARGMDGTLFCFGANASGQLGIGSSTEPSTPTPTQVMKLGTRTGRLAAGAAHVCAFTEDDGQVHCWGDNRSGQLGTGDLDRRLEPTGPIDQANLGKVRTNQLFAGGSHTCALRDDNTLWCWGGNRFGQLGMGDTDSRPLPTQVLSNVAAAYAGGQHTCALLTDGSVKCWGNNQYGQLGSTAAGAQSLVPIVVLPPCSP